MKLNYDSKAIMRDSEGAVDIARAALQLLHMFLHACLHPPSITVVTFHFKRTLRYFH